MEIRQVIPNLSGGLCTLPSLDRRSNEVQDCWNMLFSNTHGAYKRPGTEIISDHFILNPGCKIENGRPTNVEDPMDPRYYGRFITTFPITSTVYQIVMIGSGVWETGWIDISDETHANEFLSVTPEGEPLDTVNNQNVPMLRGMNDYFIYDLDDVECPAKGPHPREVFRVTRVGGRIFVVNKRKKVKFTRKVGNYDEDTNTRGNQILHDHQYQLIFYAITSGQPIVVNVSWIAHWDDKYRKYDWSFTMANLNIETIAEEFVKTWGTSERDYQDFFVVSGLRKTVAIRVKNSRAVTNLIKEGDKYLLNTGTNLNPKVGEEINFVTESPRDSDEPDIKVSNVEFKFSHVAAHVLDSTVSGGNQIPSYQARPETSTDEWILKVTGGTDDTADDVWIKFQGDK